MAVKKDKEVSPAKDSLKEDLAEIKLLLGLMMKDLNRLLEIEKLRAGIG